MGKLVLHLCKISHDYYADPFPPTPSLLLVPERACSTNQIKQSQWITMTEQIIMNYLVSRSPKVNVSCF